MSNDSSSSFPSQLNLPHTQRIKMGVASTLALCATIAGASALQIPFLSSLSQTPVQLSNDSKPLINSTALQDLISGDRLLTRAKKLFEIAKLGEIEYNHPTRVIGSAGMFTHVTIVIPISNKSQVTLARWLTFTSLFSNLGLTMTSQTSHSQLCQATSTSPAWFLVTLCRNLLPPWD
jgi:hypothetical protein